eukprot:5928197-Pyramimonas_sp.AAC.1
MEAKFENIQEQLPIISAISRTPSTAASSDSGGTFRRKRPAAGPMPDMFTDTLQNNEKDMHNPCRIWIGGWPREALSQYRKEHWEWYKTQVPQDMVTNAQPSFQRTSRSYSVVFETEEAANRFKQWAFTSPSQWSDY